MHKAFFQTKMDGLKLPPKKINPVDLRKMVT